MSHTFTACELPDEDISFPAERSLASADAPGLFSRAFKCHLDAMFLCGRPLRSSRYTFGPYSSGTIHFATMGPLLPATLYFYKIQGRSQLFHFTSLPAVGPSATLHLALVGGWPVLLLPVCAEFPLRGQTGKRGPDE